MTAYRLLHTTQRSGTIPGAVCLILQIGTGFKLTSFTPKVQVKTSSIAHNLRTYQPKLPFLRNELVKYLYMFFSWKDLFEGCPKLPKTGLGIKIRYRQAQILEQRAAAIYRKSSCRGFLGQPGKCGCYGSLCCWTPPFIHSHSTIV